jgi:hypothetical protein
VTPRVRLAPWLPAQARVRASSRRAEALLPASVSAQRTAVDWTAPCWAEARLCAAMKLEEHGSRQRRLTVRMAQSTMAIAARVRRPHFHCHYLHRRPVRRRRPQAGLAVEPEHCSHRRYSVRRSSFHCLRGRRHRRRGCK